MRYLRDLHRRLKSDRGGQVASYIPELALASPDDFGIAMATVDGVVYAVGDVDKAFTIQSISKAFVYGYVLAEYGREFTLTKVGVEPSGDAFNAIVFDEVANRPFNPMVNAGAIATAALIKGKDVPERIQTMRLLFERLAGRPLTFNQKVFESERSSGHRNRAIAWMMLNAGMIDGDPDEALDVYFTQCSIEVTCRDIALMAATLANGGVQPVTRQRVLASQSVRDVISVMNSCGMYNYAGQWSFEVGLPAKSGVGGGIIAVAPGQLGLAVYSPPLDQLGNSVRGIAAFKAISTDFSLHPFGAHSHGGAVIRRQVAGDIVRSKRQRSPEDVKLLDASAKCVRLIELQGALYFGTVEQLLRNIEAQDADARWIVLDFRRVHVIDNAAGELLLRTTGNENGPKLIFASLGERFASFLERLTNLAKGAVFPDADAALEWCEDHLIGAAATGLGERFGLGQLSIFAGLSKEELKLIEALVNAQVYEAGDVIMREGDTARLFYVLARGRVSVRLRGPAGGSGKRVATFGPGLSFGEMALFDGGRRSADIVAEDHVVCYGFVVDKLREIGIAHPNVLITILSNVTREMAARLRRANEEIRALEA